MAKGYVGGSSIKSIKETLDGGYILGCGSTLGIVGDKTEPNIGGTGSEDYWIIKTDNLGNIQWQNSIGGNGRDYIQDIFVNADGSFLLQVILTLMPAGINQKIILEQALILIIG